MYLFVNFSAKIQVNMVNLECVFLWLNDIHRRLGTFEALRFEFDYDDSDSIRFENDGLIQNFSNRPHLPSYHKPRSLFNKKTSTVVLL